MAAGTAHGTLMALHVPTASLNVNVVTEARPSSLSDAATIFPSKFMFRPIFMTILISRVKAMTHTLKARTHIATRPSGVLQTRPSGTNQSGVNSGGMPHTTIC